MEQWGSTMESLDIKFYKNRKVLVTGHTGFKGSWLCKILLNAGADVTGYALDPPTSPSLFALCRLDTQMRSILGDIRDFSKLCHVIQEINPDIIFHLAAQPLVRESYESPRITYETNVMGTVNLLESVRTFCKKTVSLVNVTTDKVYQNQEWFWGYREDETLNGFDPYANSKSCSELVTQCYRNSFFQNQDIRVSTVRAGNVIGGGDFSKDRIIPDCVRAVQVGKPILVRNPYSVRPYQHVLEPLFVYLMIAQKQYESLQYVGSYNVGPDENGCVDAGTLADQFCQVWGEQASWEYSPDFGPHEASYLKLDCSKLKSVFRWKPRWNLQMAVEKTVEWFKQYLFEKDISTCIDQQIRCFVSNSEIFYP